MASFNWNMQQPLNTCSDKLQHPATEWSRTTLIFFFFHFSRNVLYLLVSRLFYLRLRGWCFYRLPTWGFPCLKSTWVPLLREKSQWALTDKSWKESVLLLVSAARQNSTVLTKQSCNSQMLWQTDSLLFLLVCLFFKDTSTFFEALQAITPVIYRVFVSKAVKFYTLRSGKAGGRQLEKWIRKTGEQWGWVIWHHVNCTFVVM